jgi:CRP-like cAMP-binding protein
MGDTWPGQLKQLAASAATAEVRNTAGRLLGMQVEQLHQHLSLTEVMLFLKRVPIYSNLSLEQLYTITTHLTEREIQPGEVIFHEGDLSNEFYLVVSGAVHIVKQRGETTYTIATDVVGDYFGEMANFENRPRSAGAVAAEAGILLVLSPEHFRQIILQDPAISFEFFRELSARLRRFDQEMAAAMALHE